MKKEWLREGEKYMGVNIFAKYAIGVEQRVIAGTEVCSVSEVVLWGDRQVIDWEALYAQPMSTYKSLLMFSLI